MTHVRSTLVRFVGALRTAGVEVPADGSLVAAEALATVGFDDETTARTALRAALLSRPEDRETFDRLFDRFWTQMQDIDDENVDLSSLDGGLDPGDGSLDSGDDGPGPGDESRDGEGGRVRTRRVENGDSTRADADETLTRYSPTGASTRVESETLGMVDEPRAAVQALTDALASRPGRRRRPSSPGQPDVRRAMRESHATGGVVMDLPEHAPRPTTVRGLVLVDVSRSVLDTLDREFLVSVLRALTDEWREVRTFLFDTDVTEVTAALRAESPETTLQEFDRLEAAWGGGTRIGHALTTVRDTAPTAVDRDTVVLILSDGLETGEVSQLEAGISWLDRRARRVFWLNPLAVSTAYEPTCRGMAAALPHVDGLFAFAEPADLFDLARQISRRRHPVGYEHDWRRTER